VTLADQGWRGMADGDLWQGIQDERRWLVTAKEFADPPGTPAVDPGEPPRVFGARAAGHR
jgi:hypothetical protein